MRIAVVDDDYTARTLISEFLEDEGHNVVAVDDPKGLEGVESYGAIIMDVMIGSDRHAGIDYILEQLADGKIGSHTLVVFISNFGRDTADTRRRLQQVGNYRWLDKPIELTELDQIIRKTTSEKEK